MRLEKEEAQCKVVLRWGLSSLEMGVSHSFCRCLKVPQSLGFWLAVILSPFIVSQSGFLSDELMAQNVQQVSFEFALNRASRLLEVWTHCQKTLDLVLSWCYDLCVFEDVAKDIALSPGIFALCFRDKTEIYLCSCVFCFGPIRGRLVYSQGGKQVLETFLTFKSLGPGNCLRLHANVNSTEWWRGRFSLSIKHHLPDSRALLSQSPRTLPSYASAILIPCWLLPPSTPFHMNVHAPLVLSGACIQVCYIFPCRQTSPLWQIYIPCVLFIPNTIANVASHS